MRESFSVQESDTEDTEDIEQQKALAAEVEQYLSHFKTLQRGMVLGSTEGDSWYDFFQSSESRNELFYYCKKIAEHLHENKIPNLVIIDRSSRPLYIGVMEYWRKYYPEEKMPGIYFMNPKGFKVKDTLTVKDVFKIKMDAEWKDDLKEPHTKARGEQEIIDEVAEVYSKLYVDKDKPVLIFDSCIHSGDTLSPVKDILEKSGFEQIKIGAVNPSDLHSKVPTDFFITKERPDMGCYPFDRDRMIEKTFDHIYSQKTKNPKLIALGIMLRQEIKRIINDNLDLDDY